MRRRTGEGGEELGRDQWTDFCILGHQTSGRPEGLAKLVRVSDGEEKRRESEL